MRWTATAGLLLGAVLATGGFAVEGIAMERLPEGIHETGVGRVVLGRPLPKDLIPRDPESGYRTGYHGDAQPHEGFWLEEPPVTVFLAKGPFQSASRRGFVDPERARGLARKAAQAARGGARVSMIQVEAPEVKTARGLGVGSRLEMLRAAHPDLVCHPVPPTFGGDECVAVSPSMPLVHFYFRDCQAAEAGEPVVRVLLFRE